MLLISIDKSTLTPKNDGITHYNIYSRAKSDVGKFLSHFTHHPIQTEDGLFVSMEGYWYWLELRDDRLRTVFGHEAKVLGDQLRLKCRIMNKTPDFHKKIIDATYIKLDTMPENLKVKLLSSRLPLIHAYVNGDKYSMQSSMDFIIKQINFWRLRNAHF